MTWGGRPGDDRGGVLCPKNWNILYIRIKILFFEANSNICRGNYLLTGECFGINLAILIRAAAKAKGIPD
jgi:hypothetical protein